MTTPTGQSGDLPNQDGQSEQGFDSVGKNTEPDSNEATSSNRGNGTSTPRSEQNVPILDGPRVSDRPTAAEVEKTLDLLPLSMLALL